MERYDYYKAVKEDVLEYIREEINFTDYETVQELEQELNEKLWIADSVTGNASGSYFFNAWKAEEALCHNLELLGEALESFGCDGDYLMKYGVEAADVTIRCYVLPTAISEAIEEIESDFDEAWAIPMF